MRTGGGAVMPTCAATPLYTSCGMSEGNKLTEAAPMASRPRAV